MTPEAFAASAEFHSRYGNLGNQQFVSLVYQNVLGRPSDAAGLAFSCPRGLTRGQMMIQFSESAEYTGLIGAEVLRCGPDAAAPAGPWEYS